MTPLPPSEASNGWRALLMLSRRFSLSILSQWRDFYGKVSDQRNSQAITALSTFVLGVLTMVLAYLSSAQTNIQRYQLSKIETTLRQTSDLIKDADQQAAAATNANQLSLWNSYNQLKAYMSYEDILFQGMYYSTAIKLKNGDQTPAFHYSGRIRSVIADQSDIQKYLDNGLDDRADFDDHNENVIGPGLYDQPALNPSHAQ